VTQELQLPRSQVAEQAILGAILIDNSYANSVYAKIEPIDFYYNPNQRIATAISKLLSDDKKVDIVTVGAFLAKTKELKFVGGYESISALMDGVPETINIEEYVDEVLEMSARRKAIAVCQKTIASMTGPVLDTNRLIGQSAIKLREILGLTDQGGFQHIGEDMEVLRERHARIQETHIGDGVQIPGSFISLHNVITQFDRGDVHVIAGRPTMGKTSLATSLAIAQAESGYRIGFVSLEMNRYQTRTRILSQLTSIPYKAINEGGGYSDIGAGLSEGYDRMGGLPIWIDASSSVEVNTCVSRCEALVEKCLVDIIYIDYLQLFTPGEGHMRLNRNLQVAAAMAELKTLAKRADIPIVVLAQLNRDPSKRADAQGDIVYLMSDLGESDFTSHAAATIMFIHLRPDKTAYVQVEKQRNGLAGPNVRAWFKLVAPTMKYVDEDLSDAGYEKCDERY
jgi:replicative DNA helicase